VQGWTIFRRTQVPVLIITKTDMKLKLLLTVVIGMICSSAIHSQAAENPLVSDFKTFIQTVETDGKNYTKEQWDEANKQFDVLVDRFKKQKDSLSQEEKDVIHDAIGRYKAAVTNSGFDSAIKGMTKTYNTVANATTDAFHETQSFFKGLFKKKDKDGEKKDDGKKE